jgi:protein tyrosine kinase modulator
VALEEWGMIDTLAQLRARSHAIWRRRWVALGTCWALMLLGSTVVLLLPDQYEASARVYVDADSLMGPLLKGIAVQDDLSKQLAVMQSTLLSRPNLMNVVRSVYPALAGKDEFALQDLLDRIESRTTIQVSSSKLFQITHVESDPRLAKDIVQALLGVLVDNNLGQDRADMDNAQSFIAKQVALYETQLRTLERSMAEFRAKHPGVMSTSEASFSQRLDKAQADVYAASAELDAAKAEKDRLAKQVKTAPQVFPDISPDDAAKDPTLAKVEELKAELSQKLAIYSDHHPVVVALKQQLASLEMQNAASKVGVSEQRLALAEDALKRLKERGSAEIMLEAKMADMNRDYAVLKNKYEELRVRAESARISSDVRADTGALRFRVIDPPNVPPIPSGPKRRLLLIAVLFASLGGGLALAFLLSEMDDSFATPRELRRAFALPLLGSVCLVPSKADENMRYYDALAVSMGAGALVVLCGLLILLSGSILRFSPELGQLRLLASSWLSAGL